jgi:hypothetical protein
MRQNGNRFASCEPGSVALWAVLASIMLHFIWTTTNADAQALSGSVADPPARPKSPQQLGVPAEAAGPLSLCIR